MGYQITEASAGSTDWTTTSTIMNFSMKGFMGLSLTNYNTTDVPLIAKGSKVEVAGALYYFASTEAITGSLSTNQNYIMVTTSSSSISASYTTDAPTWVASKNGWYDSSTGSQRYIGGCATEFGGKWTYGFINAEGGQERIAEQGGNTLLCKVIEIGDWDMDADISKNIAHGLTLANVRDVSAMIRADSLASFTPLRFGSPVAGYISVDPTNVSLVRVNALTYDSTTYASTSINRGWIKLWYEI